MAEMNGIPEGFTRIDRISPPPTTVANFTTDEEGKVSGNMTTDPSRYSTFTASEKDVGVKNPYNRKTHLRCEFGNPNGAHSDGGKATHLIYLNGGPTADPLETPMAACAHHEVKIRERAAELNPDVQPYFRPIINRRMIAEHRQKLDVINKDLTLSMEAMLREAGVKPGTPEALFGRDTENFYTRGKVPSSTGNRHLDEVKKRRAGQEAIDSDTSLDQVLERAHSDEGAGRAPEGFDKVTDKGPFKYAFPIKRAEIKPAELDENGNLPIEAQGAKKKVAHVMRLHKGGAHIDDVMAEAHRLGVHSEVESLMNTHMQNFTTSSDEEGNVTIKPGRRPQRSRGTVQVEGRGRLAEKLPMDKAEIDLGTGETRALTPIEAYTEGKFEETLSDAEIEQRQEDTAAKLREREAFRRMSPKEQRAELLRRHRASAQGEFGAGQGQLPPPSNS